MLCYDGVGVGSLGWVYEVFFFFMGRAPAGFHMFPYHAGVRVLGCGMRQLEGGSMMLMKGVYGAWREGIRRGSMMHVEGVCDARCGSLKGGL